MVNLTELTGQYDLLALGWTPNRAGRGRGDKAVGDAGGAGSIGDALATSDTSAFTIFDACRVSWN